MRQRCLRPQKVLQLIVAITAQCATQRTALQAQAPQLQPDLAKIMRRFGRQCRGIGNVYVTLVRQTERQVLERGQLVLPLAWAAQVHLAYTCGYSRPVVESIIASLRCRRAWRLTYKGHRGAIVQTGMAVMAHNAATWVRIHEYPLSKRARPFRRRQRLRCRKVNQCHASIN